MTKLVNLTGHELRLTDGSTIVVLPSQGRARVVSKSREMGLVELSEFKRGLPIVALSEQEIVNLPLPEADTIFVVSGIVASAASDRDDVVAPGRILRDSENGRVVGCQGFVKPVKGEAA